MKLHREIIKTWKRLSQCHAHGYTSYPGKGGYMSTVFGQNWLTDPAPTITILWLECSAIAETQSRSCPSTSFKPSVCRWTLQFGSEVAPLLSADIASIKERQLEDEDGLL